MTMASTESPWGKAAAVAAAAVNGAIQASAAARTSIREQELDQAAIGLESALAQAELPLTIQQSKLELGSVLREQYASLLEMEDNNNAIAQAVADRTRLLREVESIRQSFEANQASIRSRFYADPIHLVRSDNAILKADAAFANAQRWMFYLLRALEYKWNNDFVGSYAGRNYDSGSVFKLRNAEELKDLFIALQNFNSTGRLGFSQNLDQFTVISLRNLLSPNPASLDPVDPTDRGVRVDKVTGQVVTQRELFRRKLKSLRNGNGDVVIPVNTTRLSDTDYPTFFIGPLYALNGAITHDHREPTHHLQSLDTNMNTTFSQTVGSELIERRASRDSVLECGSPLPLSYGLTHSTGQPLPQGRAPATAPEDWRTRKASPARACGGFSFGCFVGFLSRWIRLAFAAAAAVVAIIPCAALGGTQSFTTPGSFTYTVPADVTEVTITAVGAAGGPGSDLTLRAGGGGATMSGKFTVTGGGSLRVYVGEKGRVGSIDSRSGAGGGGGTAVILNQATVLVAAAGGGGGGRGGPGTGGLASINSVAGGGAGFSATLGGAGGGGFGAAGGSATSGAGTATGGGAGTLTSAGAGGTGISDDSSPLGGNGGSGWGGGGGSASQGGGGGGGYKGGDGATGNGATPQGKGGDSFFNGSGTLLSAVAGADNGGQLQANSGNGSVTIVDNAPPAPEIAVEQPAGTGIADGGSKNFGNVVVGGNTSLTFTIKNTGSADLTGLGITIDGTDAAQFTVTASPTAPVSGPSGSTTFTVRFASTSAGAKAAALHIANNDGDENPFDIALAGVGILSDHDVTTTGDPIVPTSNNSPANERAANAIDNNIGTKYLNFDKLNTGFTVTPQLGSTIVSGLTLTSANDAPERDPASYTLEGSNDGIAFTPISSGAVPAFPGRFFKNFIFFNNTVPYLRYRLLFPTVANAGAANSMQIAEVELLGVTVTVAVNVAPSFTVPAPTVTAAGANWTARDSDQYWSAIASSSDGTRLAAVVYSGQIYVSTDSGANWTARESNRDWQSIASSADGMKLAAAVYNGQIYTSVEITTLHTLFVAANSGAYTSNNFATNISPGPPGEAGQIVTFTVVNSQNALFSVPPAISSAGTLTFTPAANAIGSATVTVVAHDNGGTVQGGVDTSGPQSFTITVLPAPVARNVTYTRAPGLSLRIRVADIASDVNHLPLAVQSLGASGQGATLSFNGTYIFYEPANNNNDSFTYTVTNTANLAATGTITVLVAASGGLPATITVSGGVVTLKFFGVPGFTYDVQRTTSLTEPVTWTTLTPGSPIAPGADGSFNYADSSPPGGAAFYRSLKH